MADVLSPLHGSELLQPAERVGLTRAEFDELTRELDVLRGKHQAELAARLRDARAYGSPGDNEDVAAVHEEASVLGVRIARLEELLRSTPILERKFDGCVSLGCTVRVSHPGGRVAEYVLVGRRRDSSSVNEVSSGSPVGRALMGARPDHVVRVELPNGRDRELRILAVKPSSVLADLEADAEAA